MGGQWAGNNKNNGRLGVALGWSHFSGTGQAWEQGRRIIQV